VIKTNNIELREKIVKLALAQYHKDYVHGKMGPDTFDCAGFVWYLYNEICNINIFEGGIGLSTTTKIMTSKYGNLTLFNENDFNKDLALIRKGDVLFFHRQSLADDKPTPNNKYPGHCGIYLGNNRFIHATRSKKRVIINNFQKCEYWLNVLVGVKDIIDDKMIKMKK